MCELYLSSQHFADDLSCDFMYHWAKYSNTSTRCTRAQRIGIHISEVVEKHIFSNHPFLEQQLLTATVPAMCKCSQYALKEVERTMRKSCSGFPTTDIAQVSVYLTQVISKIPDVLQVLAKEIGDNVQLQLMISYLTEMLLISLHLFDIDHS